MNDTYRTTLEMCKCHADRLTWAMSYLRPKFPLSIDVLRELNDIELAILDQFATRFSKLQDVMGAKLFPSVSQLIY